MSEKKDPRSTLLAALDMSSQDCFQSIKGVAQNPEKSFQRPRPQVLLSRSEHQLEASCFPLRYVLPSAVFVQACSERVVISTLTSHARLHFLMSL